MLSAAPLLPQFGWCWLPPTAPGDTVTVLAPLSGSHLIPLFYSPFVFLPQGCVQSPSHKESASGPHTQPARPAPGPRGPGAPFLGRSAFTAHPPRAFLRLPQAVLGDRMLVLSQDWTSLADTELRSSPPAILAPLEEGAGSPSSIHIFPGISILPLDGRA